MNNFSRRKAFLALASFAAAATLSTAASANPFEELFGPFAPTVQAPAYASPDEDAIAETRSQFCGARS